MNFDQIIQTISIWIIPVLFAVTLHEAAHGYAAKRLGDTTAQMLGRLSLNPLRHIDPIGTVVVPLVLLVLGGFIFGWAKPVPVNFNNLRNPRRDMALVAAAGPMANLGMVFFWALLMKLGLTIANTGNSFAVPLTLMGQAGISINLVLMILNLLPLPPLDGGRVLSGVLPPVWSERLDRIEPYGLIILVVLLITHMLSMILGPIYSLIGNGIYNLFGLPHL
ncbi:site-2 protease family protein [Acidihalobacter prosperus]